MFSGFFGWHLLFIVGVLVLIGLLAWGASWVMGRAAHARPDAEEPDRRGAS